MTVNREQSYELHGVGLEYSYIGAAGRIGEVNG